MKEIAFTLAELEPRLITKQVTQTIRSKSELDKHKWVKNDEVIVRWRSKELGRARITLIEPTKIKDLTEEDAIRCGVEPRERLLEALWRFFARLFGRSNYQKFLDYTIYRVQFEWL